MAKDPHSRDSRYPLFVRVSVQFSSVTQSFTEQARVTRLGAAVDELRNLQATPGAQFYGSLIHELGDF